MSNKVGNVSDLNTSKNPNIIDIINQYELEKQELIQALKDLWAV
jgi:hypothetical protein